MTRRAPGVALFTISLLLGLSLSGAQAAAPKAGANSRIEVADYGLKPDCSSDNLAAWNRLIATIARRHWNGVIIHFPQGCFAFSAETDIPVGLTASVTGEGANETFLYYESPSGNGLVYGKENTREDFGWGGFAVAHLSLSAGPRGRGPSPPLTIWHSSGTGLAMNGVGGNNVLVHDVMIRGFARAADLEGGWNQSWTDDAILIARTGIKHDCNPAFAASAGTSFTRLTAQDSGLDASAIGDGIRVCEGAPFFSDDQILGFRNGLHVAPAAGRQSEGIVAQDLILDSASNDGLYLDANRGGTIVAAHFIGLWAGFNNNEGVSIDARSGGRISGISVTGGQIRENGSYGIRTRQGKGTVADIAITGNQITANDRSRLDLASAGRGCKNGTVVRLRGGSGGPVDILYSGSSAPGLFYPDMQNWSIWATAAPYKRLPRNPVATTRSPGSPPGTGCAIYPRFTIESALPTAAAGIDLDAPAAVVTGNAFGNFASSSASQGAGIVLDADADHIVAVANTGHAQKGGYASAVVVNRSRSPACRRGQSCATANNLAY